MDYLHKNIYGLSDRTKSKDNWTINNSKNEYKIFLYIFYI